MSVSARSHALVVTALGTVLGLLGGSGVESQPDSSLMLREAARSGSFELLEAELEAQVVDHYVQCPPEPSRRCSVLLLCDLLDRPGGERVLYRLHHPESGDDRPRLTIVVDGLSKALHAAAALDVDRDGLSDPILGGDDLILWVDHEGLLRSLLRQPFLELAQSRRLSDPNASTLPVPALGRLDLYGAFPGGAIREGSFPLPVQANKRSGAVRLTTPALRLVPQIGVHAAAVPPPDASTDNGEASSRAAWYVSLPTVEGPSRWSVAVVFKRDLDDGTSVFEPETVWLRTPTPERPVKVEVVAAGGEPLMLVHSLASDRVGLLERKKVRLYPLRSDRTRAGRVSLVDHKTASRFWQELVSRLVDVDGDGVEDLVLFQREGLAGDALQIDVLRGHAGATGRIGRFDSPSLRSKWKTPGARWGYVDATGDAVLDLVLVSDAVAIHPGLAAEDSKKRPKSLVAKEPVATLALPRSSARDASDPGDVVTFDLADSEARATKPTGDASVPAALAEDRSLLVFDEPLTVDLDGDGAAELLVVGRSGTRSIGDAVVVVRREGLSSQAPLAQSR